MSRNCQTTTLADGCFASDYHTEGRYTDPELIFRNELKTERFIAMADDATDDLVDLRLL